MWISKGRTFDGEPLPRSANQLQPLPVRVGMIWEQWFTAGVIVVTIVLLIRDVFPPAVAVTGAMVAALTAGIISPDEALAGFSNPAPVTIRVFR